MPQGLSPLSTDVLPHKRQVVVDRLRRRMESYRRRQNDCQPRFDQSFTGLCEQNLQETLALKQRFLETKAKRGQNKNNKQDKKQHLQHQVPQPQSVVGPGGDGGAMSAAANAAALQSSVHVQKFLKRTNDDMDNVSGPDGLEPPVKLQCTTQHNQAHGGHQGNEGPMKFSVEIVQQLEFTTSAANSQPQQISTNVTVKALTNASVKSDVASPKSSNPSTPASGSLRPNSNIGCVDIGTLVECKQEPDNDFADLDQCAAALEKDAQANGGNSFPGFSDLMGDDTNEEIINSEDLKNLISEISDLNPEFMKDFDFEDKSVIGANCSGVVGSNNNNDIGNINNHPPNDMKVEDTKDLNLVHQQNQNVLDVKSSQSPMLQNAYSPPVYEGQGLNKNRIPYSNMDFTKTELSPAAQTLKQMAEQHQHKNQMGLAFNPAGTRVSNSRSPYTDFQFPGNDFIGGSPNSNQQNVNFHNKNTGFPQPPEMIKQELNMFNNQPKSGNGPSGPGMYKQQYSPYGSPSANHGSPGYMPRGGGPSGGPQNGPPPRPPSGPGGNPQQSGTTLQINQAQQLHISQPGHGIQVSAGQHLHLSGDLKGGVSVAAQQGMYFNQQQAAQQNQQQQHPHNTTHQQQQQQSTPNNPHGNGSGPNNAQNQQSQQQNIHNQQNQHQQNNAQQNSAQQQSQLSMVQNQQLQQGDNFTVSQSQTINFTQQSLRQRAAAAAANNNPIVPSMAGRHPGPPQGSVIPGSMAEHPHAKLVQQQQILRAQQAAAMQQQHMASVRPPPPDYKASAALMHSGPARFPTAPPTNIRRLTQQPMPPSGPMMRPHNMYMMGPQHMSRAAYPRPQGPIGMGNNDGVGMGPQHPGTDWRHILMTQQQNASYGNGPTQIRPSFQHQGFGMANTNNIQQMTAMQHQQMRIQQQNMTTTVTGPLSGQSAVMGMGAQGPLGTGGPINSSSNMINQQIMSHTQQQSIMQQQGPAQMSISSMHMSQQQTMSINNVNMHQQHQNNTQQQQQQQQQITNNINSVVNNQQNNNPLANFGQSTPDFSLDFLETLPAGDTSNFSAQDILNSLDNEFNLQDIL